MLIFASQAWAQIGNGRIALADFDDRRATQIFTMNPDGSDRIQLTSGPDEHWMPAGHRTAEDSPTSRVDRQG
jgi:hypothetical protein